MTTYESFTEVGLYREETGLVCAAGDITVSAPVASNVYTDLRNKPSTDDTYTLGVEWLRNTTDSTWNAADITAVSGSTITIGAGHNGDSFNIGYYARGTAVGSASQAIQDDDYVRAEHPDAILKAYNLKGHVDPISDGMVFDQVMIYKSPAVDSVNTTVIDTDADPRTYADNGYMTFDNYRPFYVTSIRVEVISTAIQTGKGVSWGLYEDATQLASGTLSDAFNWMVNEYNDGVNTWYSATWFLGMCLMDNLVLKVQTYNSNTDLSTGEIFIYISGWHLPDPMPSWGITEEFDSHTAAAPAGLYIEKIYTAGSSRRVSLSPSPLATMDENFRTRPHNLGQYRYGIEFIKNLTQDKYVTEYLEVMSTGTISMDRSVVDASDKLLFGYYTAETLASEIGVEAGSTIEPEHVEALLIAMNRVDRLDFAENNFPWDKSATDNDEFVWAPIMFGIDQDRDDVQTRGDIGEHWITLFQFDPDNYEARVVETIGTTLLPRSTYEVDETPFFVTGFFFECDEDAIDTIRYDNAVEFRFTFTVQPSVNQGKNSLVRYYPMSSCVNKAPHPESGAENTPSAWYGDSMYIASEVAGSDTGGPFFYLPLGMFRCYNVRVDIRVRPGEAFQSIRLRQANIEGWMKTG